MVPRVATVLFCLGLCLCTAAISLCDASGPGGYPQANCAPAPAPCGPPPCAPPTCGPPSPFALCGGILSACTSICGACIGIPAAIMGGILAPPRMPARSCAPPPCPPPMCGPPPMMCAPAPVPPPITKCKPVASCGPTCAHNAGGYYRR
jgi:hypothetical protein